MNPPPNYIPNADRRGLVVVVEVVGKPIEADLFYVNEIPFLLSMSQKIKFLTLECIPNRSSNTLTVGLNRVVSLYRRAGYSVKIILLDMEFECLEEFLDVPINVAAAREHVPGIEREIRTIKERGRALVNTSPFNKFPRGGSLLSLCTTSCCGSMPLPLNLASRMNTHPERSSLAIVFTSQHKHGKSRSKYTQCERRHKQLTCQIPPQRHFPA